MDNEALKRQQELVRAAANGQTSRPANGVIRPDVRKLATDSAPVSGSSHDSATKERPGHGHEAMNGIKSETSQGHSPALGVAQPNGIGPIRMPPPMLSNPRPPSVSPRPQSAGVNGVAPSSHAHTLFANSGLRQPGKGKDYAQMWEGID